MTPLQYFLAIIFILARVALLVGELSGEHLCHKRETYTVTMRVLVKEPVQVKSYTWCLKVPPRCTKYKVEMRDKFKMQTELKERVVDVCCAGYAPDRTETHCLPVCSGCVHGVCATPDSCTCEPGYKGDRCETECEEGQWGAGCEQKCLCKNEAECHHVTGDCKCAEGWRGTECEKPCPRGTYGEACVKECNCGDSIENSTCHHVTGECIPILDSSASFPTTTVTPLTSMKPQETPNQILTLDSETHQIDSATEENQINTAMRTSEIPKSEVYTILPTRTSFGVNENDHFPSTEKHVFYFDNITTIVPETSAAPTTTTTTTTATEVPTTTTSSTTTTITIPTPTTTTATSTVIITTTRPVTNTIFLDPKEVERTTLQNEIDNTIMTKPTDKTQVNTDEDNNISDSTRENDPEPTKSENNGEMSKDEATTMPHNFQMPPNGIIVISDGLLSDRRDVEEGDGKSKNSKDSFWDLVSSVSVAGGVALALIVMAAITLLVSHRRNRKTMPIAGRKTSSQRRRETELPPPPAPQMYNYTEDVSTLPLRHLFPDVTYQPRADRPESDGLQLKFGDVATAVASDIGHPFHDMRAYLELQYDIPPSSIGSKTNSFQPGMENSFQTGIEPEHLYDEIPCWRSNTTASTNTDTDTSRC